jgi:hypothetical protein
MKRKYFSGESKVPCAKTVLSLIRSPFQKRRTDPEKMSKLIQLIRDEYPQPEDIKMKSMEDFLQRQSVIDIFASPESKLNAAPRHQSMAHSANKGSGTEELTQTQADIFKNIRKYPDELSISAPFKPSPLTPLKPGSLNSSKTSLVVSHNVHLTYIFLGLVRTALARFLRMKEDALPIPGPDERETSIFKSCIDLLPLLPNSGHRNPRSNWTNCLLPFRSFD